MSNEKKEMVEKLKNGDFTAKAEPPSSIIWFILGASASY